MKFNTLTDLRQIRKEIAAQAQRQADELLRQQEEAKRQAQSTAQRAAQRNLFRAAVARVQEIEPPQRANLSPPPPPAIPKQMQQDEAAALQEALSDEVDVSSLLDTDAQLSFRRPGVGPDVPHKLRRGKWSIQCQIDLHGLRSDEAREALAAFIRTSHQQGIRCVRVVHGKGLGSPGKAPVLKDKVQRWLVQKEEVIVFVQAPPSQGGAGALLVLLQAGQR